MAFLIFTFDKRYQEDNALGKLTDARYAALDEQYAKEQNTLAAEIADLDKAIRRARLSGRWLHRQYWGRLDTGPPRAA